MKTDTTKSNYAYAMNRFMKILVANKLIDSTGDYEQLLTFNSDKITNCLEDFVNVLSQNIKPNGIPPMIAAPELFFEMNRKIWHKKLVRKSIPKNDMIESGKDPITTDELLSLIQSAKHPRDIALIHFFASTGSRPSSLLDPVLRMKHLAYMPNPNNPTKDSKWCYAVKIYAESKEEYWAFLTPEATVALERYFGWRKQIRKEVFDDETPIFSTFAKKAKNSFLSDNGLRGILRALINSSVLIRKKNGVRYNKAIVYMFRKRFNTILKLNNDVNSNIAEKLMAHKRGLDGTYLQPTREECYREFVKAIPQLTVDPTERLKLENEKKQEKIDQLGAKTQEVIEKTKLNSDLEERVKELERMYLQSKNAI